MNSVYGTQSACYIYEKALRERHTMNSFPISIDIFDTCRSLVEGRRSVVLDPHSNCSSNTEDAAVRIVLVSVAEEIDDCLDDEFLLLLV